jgi:Pyridoxamine 5'-phosphate oxidase
MSLKQGDLALLNEPLAQELLHAPIPARLAYVWSDGTPRVIPIWFQWTGEEIVLCSPPNAPKMKALAQDSKVALTIDYEAWPARVLLIRGTTHSQSVEGEIPEYAAITRRYLGEEGSKAWRAQYAQMFPQSVRIAVKPEWVALVDVETRFPSAIAKAIAGMA